MCHSIGARAEITTQILDSFVERRMVVIEQSDILTFEVFIQQLHHVDHFFRRVFSADHHVDAFEISLALQVAAVAIDRCHHHEWRYCGDHSYDSAHNASGRICANCCHDVNGEKFFAVAAIVHIRMSPHYVRQLVCDDCCQL